MFNPERLLGQLVGDALSGSLGGGRRKRGGSLLGGLSGGTKAKLGLGLLGIAVAAYQHYQGQSAPANALAGAGQALPPPPPMGPTTPPPPPSAAADPARVQQALHLLRAMITAAHADGLIDDQERQAILARAGNAGMAADDLHTLDAEMRAPLTVEQLAVRTPASERAAVYAAALIAITADTDSERAFLDRLAVQLELDAAARQAIHAQLAPDQPGVTA